MNINVYLYVFMFFLRFCIFFSLSRFLDLSRPILHIFWINHTHDLCTNCINDMWYMLDCQAFESKCTRRVLVDYFHFDMAEKYLDKKQTTNLSLKWRNWIYQWKLNDYVSCWLPFCRLICNWQRKRTIPVKWLILYKAVIKWIKYANKMTKSVSVSVITDVIYDGVVVYILLLQFIYDYFVLLFLGFLTVTIR